MSRVEARGGSSIAVQVMANASEKAVQAAQIAERAKAFGREMSTGEKRDYDALLAEVGEMRDRADLIIAGEARGGDLEESFRAGGAGTGGGAVNAKLSEEIRQRVTENDNRPIEVDLRVLQSGVEARDLATTSGIGTPVSYASEIVRSMVSTSGILAAGARLVTTATGEDFKVPRSTANSTAAIVAEGGAIGESDPTVSAVTLKAYKYGVLTEATYEMVVDTSFDVGGFLAQQAGEAVGTAFGAHLATGNGTGQPSGVAGAATLGVTGGTGVTGAFTADDLIDLQHSAPSPYQRNASWVMRTTTLARVRKLKDSQNRYLFEADARPDDPQAVGLLLGRPVYLDEGVVAVGLGARSVLYGDFSRVWVRQVADLRFEKSTEFKFANDLVTFRVLHRLDGALIDPNAVRYFIGGAS